MLPRSVRLKFTKTGSLQFISHLDLNRTMKTVMIRAKIPIHYTEGFNPHPKMVFALPLSIGAESICELLDIKIDEELSDDEIVRRLNSSLSPEMRVLEAYTPESKFTDIRYAEYEICSEEQMDVSLLSKDTIIVMKRTKSGTRESDIRPLIKSWNQIDSGLRCVLSADSADYLNPEYIASLFHLKDYRIMRRKVLLSDGITEFR